MDKWSMPSLSGCRPYHRAKILNNAMMYLEIRPNTMHHFLEVTDQRQHRERGFDDHPIIPFTALTDAEVFRLPIALPKAGIGEVNCLSRDIVCA
jgi:hypothetical protein